MNILAFISVFPKTYLTVILCLLYCQMFSQCWSRISGGEFHILAISEQGHLWGWGLNESYQLGDSTTVNRNLPTLIDNGSDWMDISAGLHHSLGIKKDGTLWAWGENGYFQLGDGTNVDRPIPTQIGFDSDWVSVSAGTLHSLGLKEDGTLWVWGNSSSGQLGLGDIQRVFSPTRIDYATDWHFMTSGNNHCMALKEDHSLWAWGNNGINMQIGAGEIQIVRKPLLIMGTQKWKEIDAGIFHNVLLDDNGHIWTIGDNMYGQLGDGTFDDKGTLTIISQDKWTSITSGRTHCAAIHADSTLWTWGRNISGQLGDNSYDNSNIPLNVGTHTKWIAVEAGFSYTLGIDENGQLWSVGDNDYGQLGTGNFEASQDFVKVACPDIISDADVIVIENEINLFPNPAALIINVKWNSLHFNELQYYIINAKGQMITSLTTIGKHESISIGHLNPGVYYLRLVGADGDVTYPFIKIYGH